MAGLLDMLFSTQPGSRQPPGLLGGALPSPPAMQAQAPGAAVAATQRQGLFGQLGQTFNQMREENPEFLTGLSIGLMKGDVAGGMEWAAQQRQARLADERQRTGAMEDWNWKQTVVGEQDRQVRTAQGSATAKLLQAQGAPKSYVDLANEGYGADAWSAWNDARKGTGVGDQMTADMREFRYGMDNPEFRDYQREMAGGSGGGGPYGKPPAGFMYDPADPSRLAPIPGGPGEQISGDNAGRIGIAKSFLSDLPSIREEVGKGGATGLYDANLGRLGLGQQGRLYARIESGADALQRMLLGAGMPESEAAAYARRYMPRPTDSAEIVQSKLAQLERELSAQMDVVGRGRGGGRRAQTPLNPSAGGMQEIDGVRIRRID